MGRLRTVVATIAILVAFGILISSFVGVGGDSLPQANGTHTGYPVWHPPIPGEHNDQINYSVIIFSVIISLIVGYFAFKWTMSDNKKSLTYFVDKEANKTSTIEFDRLLAIYSIITALTGMLYFAIDVGKIWSTVGVLHNAIEIVILSALHQGGRITSNSFIAWLSFYVVFAGALSIFLEWPYDAVWFKAQGLCMDYALVIQFLRTYVVTRKGYDDESHQRIYDPERPRHDHTNGESDESGSESNLYFRPSHVLLLVFAALIHILGNLVTTIWIYEFYAYVMFSFAYCIMFPLYAYFVYLDTHSIAIPPSQKYIILPDTGLSKVILVTLTSIFLSLLSTRLGLFAQ